MHGYMKQPVPRARNVVTLALVGLGACTLYHTPRLAPAPPGADRWYSRAEVAADLDALFTTFEHVHPDLYSVVPRDSMARRRTAFLAALPDSVRRDELFPELARLVALIGDGHTGVFGSGDARRRYLAAGGRTFPISLDVDEDDALRVAGAIGGLPAGIHRGDRLLAINGHDADSLLRDFMLEMSGETTWWRARSAAQSFGGLLWPNHIEAPFTLTVRAVDGSTIAAVVPGLTQDSVAAVMARNRATQANQGPRTPNYTYRRLADGIAYIDFYSMGGDPRAFRGRIAETFAQIARDSVRAVVVDLRSNGGGNSKLGEALLAHITDKPYRTEAAKDWRASDEYRAWIRSGLNGALGWLHVEYLVPEGRRLFRARAGTNVHLAEEPRLHDRAQPFFSGPVCVLIGRGTFSSAMEIADGIKTYHLATVLGENTGGLPTAFGEVYSFRLPRTGLVASVSSARYLRASGDTTDRGPVRPDIEIHRSAEDLRLARDPVLERARHCEELPRSER
jgi:hypothetical protein